MPSEDLDQLELDIRKVCIQGGSMAPNIACMYLRKMAKVDKPRADELFEELCGEGYL